MPIGKTITFNHGAQNDNVAGLGEKLEVKLITRANTLLSTSKQKFNKSCADCLELGLYVLRLHIMALTLQVRVHVLLLSTQPDRDPQLSAASSKRSTSNKHVKHFSICSEHVSQATECP